MTVYLTNYKCLHVLCNWKYPPLK